MNGKTVFPKFIEELNKHLSSDITSCDKDKWKGNHCRSSRSDIMIGKQNQFYSPHKRINCILTKVFYGLQYEYDHEKDHSKRIEFEWNGIDLIAATGGITGTWANSARQGKWTYDIALELENDLSEFQFTIRCLFTVHATNYISIFYTDQSEENIKINLHDGNDNFPFSNWKPDSLIKGTNIDFSPGNHSLLVVFLSETEPKIVCSNSYDLPDGKGIQIYRSF